MKKYMLVADSSCDYFDVSKLPENAGYIRIPFSITANGKTFIDDGSSTVAEMEEACAASSTVGKSACPSPGIWAEAFEEGEYVIALTISKNLSGSYGSASVAKSMVLAEHPKKKIYILDSCAAGPECGMIAEKAAELFATGKPFEEICTELESYKESTKTVFVLKNFDNLVKNGRMNRIVGFVAGKLNIRIICKGSDEGTIKVVHKVKGEEKMIEAFLSELEKTNYLGGWLSVYHNNNRSLATNMKAHVVEKWKNARVTIRETTLLCSFYAERGGLIVGYETN